MKKNDDTAKAAKQLARLGAHKGGVARANTLTPKERSEIVRNAVRSRWAKEKGVPVEGKGQV